MIFKIIQTYNSVINWIDIYHFKKHQIGFLNYIHLYASVLSFKPFIKYTKQYTLDTNKLTVKKYTKSTTERNLRAKLPRKDCCYLLLFLTEKLLRKIGKYFKPCFFITRNRLRWFLLMIILTVLKHSLLTTLKEPYILGFFID